MKRKLLDFSIMKEEISQNNVLEMAELIAFTELRFQIGYLGSRAQKMYADLYGDIKHKNELGYILSDSYDLVQEGALYLCEHYGKRLNDVIGYSKKGKPILPKANKRKAPRGCRLAVYLPTDTLLRGSGQEHRGINRLRMYQIRITSLKSLSP